MIADASRFEKILKATGSGAFGNVEYDDRGLTVLRTVEVKTMDMSGTVRLYFDSKREQVLSGRRFDPMGSGLILLRPGQFYRVYTNIEVDSPLPAGVSAVVELLPDISDVLMVTGGPFREGFSGPVSFTVQPYRKVEIERMTSLGGLMFFEDTGGVSGNSDRTKKSEKTTSSRKSTSKKTAKSSSSKDNVEEEKDESVVSDEYAGNTEG